MVGWLFLFCRFTSQSFISRFGVQSSSNLPRLRFVSSLVLAYYLTWRWECWKKWCENGIAAFIIESAKSQKPKFLILSARTGFSVLNNLFSDRRWAMDAKMLSSTGYMDREKVKRLIWEDFFLTNGQLSDCIITEGLNSFPSSLNSRCSLRWCCVARWNSWYPSRKGRHSYLVFSCSFCEVWQMASGSMYKMAINPGYYSDILHTGETSKRTVSEIDRVLIRTPVSRFSR